MSAEDVPVTLPETTRFDLAPRDGGAPYRSFYRRPPGDPPAAGWPALYLLDGNATFATAVEAVRVQAEWPLGAGIAEAAIVAIGYPTDRPYDSVRRSWDYGPPPGASYPRHTPEGPEVRTGGADRFLAFLEDEARPEIARRIPLDTQNRTLFGHSFGGLFVLHALFSRPRAFARWVAASPTIYWEDFCLAAAQERFEKAPSPASVLISAAEYEQRLAPFQVGAPDEAKRLAAQARSRTVDHARAMAERLDAIDGVSARFALISGETHMSMLPTAINQAVHFAARIQQIQ